MLFVDLLSLHLVTFLMYFILLILYEAHNNWPQPVQYTLYWEDSLDCIVYPCSPFSVLGQPLPQARAPQHPHVPSVLQGRGQSTHSVICVCMYMYMRFLSYTPPGTDSSGKLLVWIAGAHAVLVNTAKLSCPHLMQNASIREF